MIRVCTPRRPDRSRVVAVRSFSLEVRIAKRAHLETPCGKGLAHFTNYTQNSYIFEWIPKPDKVLFEGDTAEWVMEHPWNAKD